MRNRRRRLLPRPSHRLDVGFDVNATIQPLTTPAQLSEWRPACDMFAGYDLECDNGADYALITHGGCQVKLTCGPCYERFRSIFIEWLDNTPASNKVSCHQCGTYLDNPWGALHLEAL
jgi:hypothetical protein